MSTFIPKVAADFETELNASVSVGAVTATLSSIEDVDGVDLASGYYAFTVDNDTEYKEYIVCDLAGTALSNVKSISAQGVVTTGFMNYHRRGASIELTDWAVLYRLVAVVSGMSGLDSGNPLFYDGAATISGATMLATKAYVDSVVAGGTVSFDQQVVSGQTAGENLTAGNSVYFKVADARWYRTDADAAATSVGVRLGIALATVSTAGTLQIAISGPVSNQSGLTPGAKYYLSSTTGAITATAPIAPANPAFIGWALSATILLLNPLPTNDQFSGVATTPSNTNKFIAQADTSAGATDQSQTTQNATTATGQANSTGLRNKVAQSFIPTKTSIKSVNLYKSANTGTFTGTVTVSIQADSAGVPSGVALASKTITNALYLAYAVGDFLALFTSEITITPGNTYWIVVETSTSDTSNCPNLGTNSAGGYTNGSLYRNNTTDGWVIVTGIDMYFKVNEGFNGKAVNGNTSGFVPSQVSLIVTKSGTQALTNGATTALAHGLGKVPALIRASNAKGSTGGMAYSSGSYAVSAGTYSESGADYNEASTGNGGVSSSRLTRVGGAATDPFSTDITVVAVDENTIIFSAGAAAASTIAYEIIG